MTFNLNFLKLLTISSSIQKIECSFSIIWIKDFAMIIFTSFKIHTFRFRKTFCKRLKRIFSTFVLKSSSIHSAKFFLNCFQSVSFFMSSQSYEVIAVCMKLFLSTLRTKALCESELFLSRLIAMKSMRFDESKSEK
jgi:hypothetical protein